MKYKICKKEIVACSIICLVNIEYEVRKSKIECILNNKFK